MQPPSVILKLSAVSDQLSAIKKEVGRAVRRLPPHLETRESFFFFLNMIIHNMDNDNILWVGNRIFASNMQFCLPVIKNPIESTIIRSIKH
jgi:hypothetical protein